MADAFDDALADLKDALTNGEDVDAAITATAGDHGVKPEALRNRATKAWGDLATYGAKNYERQVEAIAQGKEGDAVALARAAMAKRKRNGEDWTEEEKRAFDIAFGTKRFWRG